MQQIMLNINQISLSTINVEKICVVQLHANTRPLSPRRN